MKNMLLGVVLIAAASSVLLISDLKQRHTVATGLRVAIVQHASQAALDEGTTGILDALAARGFTDGKTIALKRFNAENDIATANAIAKQVTSGDFDLVITVSTLSLQTVSSANRAGKTKHVFGIVADPFGAGVGISRENPLDHPKYMTGIGSMIPVDKAFALAKELYPGLKTVGLVWNPSESNSQAFTKAARAACEKMGLKLLEANAENSTAVAEAASSLVSRSVDAVFISGDVMVLVAADSITAATRKAHIPAFSIIPPTVRRGTLFDLGANFYEVGHQVGELAAYVLSGKDLATVPVINSVPEKLAINRTALLGLKDSWRLSEDLLARAALVIDQNGEHKK